MKIIRRISMPKYKYNPYMMYKKFPFTKYFSSNINKNITQKENFGDILKERSISQKIFFEKCTKILKSENVGIYNIFKSVIAALIYGSIVMLVLEYLISGSGINPTDMFGEDNNFYTEILPDNKTDSDKKRFNKKIKKNKKNTLDDVCGNQEAKEELMDIIDFLKNPDKFKRMKAKIPKGVLLYGPPGCGKTLLARALANEANVAFLSCESSSFEQVYVGVGALRVRKLFERAREISPCIIFIDEIELLSRGYMNGSSSSSRGTTNELLTQLDGFKKNEEIIIIGATNMPNIIDKALTRSGRFDRSVNITYPDNIARKQLLELNTKNTRLAKNVDLEEISKETTFLSGADIKNLVNMAIILAIKENKNYVSKKNFKEAVLFMSTGIERKSLHLGDNIKKSQAYHEAARAIVEILTRGSSRKVKQISIIPRGRGLSSRQSVPKSEMSLYKHTKENFLAKIDTNLAGFIGEKIIFGENKVTNASASELAEATKTALKMIANLGLNENIGKISITEEDFSLLPKEARNEIDEELLRTIQKSENRVTALLEDNKSRLKAIAKALLEKETLKLIDIKRILDEVPCDNIVNLDNNTE